MYRSLWRYVWDFLNCPSYRRCPLSGVPLYYHFVFFLSLHAQFQLQVAIDCFVHRWIQKYNIQLAILFSKKIWMNRVLILNTHTSVLKLVLTFMVQETLQAVAQPCQGGAYRMLKHPSCHACASVSGVCIRMPEMPILTTGIIYQDVY